MAENYLVIGDDKYIRDREIQKLVEKYLSPADRDLNYSVHGPSDMEKLSDSLYTLPFLSEKRVVLLKETELAGEKDMENVVNYLKNPCKSSVLIIACDPSFRKISAYKDISGLVDEIDASKPDIPTLKRWVKTFFRDEKVNISDEAVDLIIELKGDDTSGIKQELEKIASYSGGRNIGAEDVESLVGRSVTETVFKLVDAINAGNAEWAYSVLADLYSQKKNSTEIIGYLSWYIRLVHTVKNLSAEGLAPHDIASETGYSVGYVKRTQDTSRRYSFERVKKWISSLLQADREIKTGFKEPSLAMEMLLAELISSR